MLVDSATATVNQHFVSMEKSSFLKITQKIAKYMEVSKVMGVPPAIQSSWMTKL